MGFLIFAPVALYQFQQLVLGNAPDLGTPLIVGFVGLLVVRTAFFIVFLAASFLLSASLLARFGIKGFFYLSLTAGSVVFAAIVIFSIFFYRPFCRLVCPSGFLFALISAKSRFKIERPMLLSNVKNARRSVRLMSRRGTTQKQSVIFACDALKCARKTRLSIAGSRPRRKSQGYKYRAPISPCGRIVWQNTNLNTRIHPISGVKS